MNVWSSGMILRWVTRGGTISYPYFKWDSLQWTLLFQLSINHDWGNVHPLIKWVNKIELEKYKTCGSNQTILHTQKRRLRNFVVKYIYVCTQFNLCEDNINNFWDIIWMVCAVYEVSKSGIQRLKGLDTDICEGQKSWRHPRK